MYVSDKQSHSKPLPRARYRSNCPSGKRHRVHAGPEQTWPLCSMSGIEGACRPRASATPRSSVTRLLARSPRSMPPQSDAIELGDGTASYCTEAGCSSIRLPDIEQARWLRNLPPAPAFKPLFGMPGTLYINTAAHNANTPPLLLLPPSSMKPTGAMTATGSWSTSTR